MIHQNILSAITRKYVGKRSIIQRFIPFRGLLESEVANTMVALVMQMLDRKLSRNVIHNKLSSFHDFMFADPKHPPHPLIQTHFIMLWANLDIYYAMNYILSAFCNGFDEVAVVTLLKQLTVLSGKNGAYVNIIKAIWDDLFRRDDMKDDVLRILNVASYSLMTLAMYHPSHDTFERLLFEAMDANQQITLVVYSCCVRKLKSIPSERVTERHHALVHSIWNNMMPLLQESDASRYQKLKWISSVLKLCSVYRLAQLEQTIKAFVDWVN